MEQERRRWKKDAERYRKLKDQFSYHREFNPINGKWFMLTASFRLDHEETLDQILDSLPEQS